MCYPRFTLTLGIFIFWAGTAFASAPSAPVDERFFAAPDVATRREILQEALEGVQRRGMREPVLVWRTGLILGGVIGDEAPGGLLAFQRLGDAPLASLPPLGQPGPNVVRVSWNSETSRVEWEEWIREYNFVIGARSTTGHYRVRLSPDFFSLVSPEVEARMRWLLLHGHLDGSELERHLVRVLWASVREKPADVEKILLRMRTGLCQAWLAESYEAR